MLHNKEGLCGDNANERAMCKQLSLVLLCLVSVHVIPSIHYSRFLLPKFSNKNTRTILISPQPVMPTHYLCIGEYTNSHNPMSSETRRKFYPAIKKITYKRAE